MSRTARSILCTALILGFGILFPAHGFGELPGPFKDGDIILQTSQSRQSEAIRLATNSKWTHCGILVHRSGVPWVYEANGPVGYRTLSDFISSGVGGKYLVLRYRKALSAGDLERLQAAGAYFYGRPYDSYFGWDDSRIYCSELVFKIFQKGLGVSVGRKQKLCDFRLGDPRVQKILRQRYGGAVPLEETVVSPASIATSPELKTVYQN